MLADTRGLWRNRRVTGRNRRTVATEGDEADGNQESGREPGEPGVLAVGADPFPAFHGQEADTERDDHDDRTDEHCRVLEAAAEPAPEDADAVADRHEAVDEPTCGLVDSHGGELVVRHIGCAGVGG